MNKSIFAIALALVSSWAWGDVTLTPQHRNLREMSSKLTRQKLDCERIIAELERENKEIAKDKKKFRKLLDSITVPEYKLVTNTTSSVIAADGSMVFDNRSQKVYTVRKVKFKQDARVRRLAKILEDPGVCAIYEKYCDNSCAEVLEEFKAEWKMVNENYNDTKTMLESNSKVYTAEVRKIDANAKREYEAAIKEIDEKMGVLKRRRSQCIVNKKPLTPDPPEVAELDRELNRLESEKKTVRRIYENNKYTKSYATAQDRKTDANDAVLAAADLRNQLQSLFMVYNAKIKDGVFQIMTRKMAENQRLIDSKKKELAQAEFLLRNPDIVTPEIADAYMEQKADDLISEMFGLDRDAVMAAAEARRAAEAKAARDEEERKYQQELSRKRDAARLAEEAENSKLERERAAAKLAEDAEQAKLERERERHRMAEEAATREVRAKAAMEEARARLQRQEEADRREQKLFEEELEYRKSKRRRLDAESDFINSL